MEIQDWKNLGFGYRDADYNIRCYFRNGKWGELEISSSNQINIHMSATALHYGQEAFEGLKAFKGKDGKIRIFRMDENAKRMQSSSDGILMERVPEEKFMEAVRMAVKMNERFVPPYESGAALYIRPLLIGTGPQIGVKPAEEYLFMVFVMPVGPYFPEGFKPTDLVIMREYDRAAPQGTGKYKVGGNYAASMYEGKLAKEKGSIDHDEYATLVKELAEIPQKERQILESNDAIKKIAEKYKDAADALYLGRGYLFPVALEGALKLKEISYIHAEGYAAGEMKHGPIALVDDNLPVVVVAPHDAYYEKIVSNIQEVKARKGNVIAIVTEGDKGLKKMVNDVIEIPKSHPALAPLLSVLPLQLLAYHIAVLRGCNVDQPRNLAKSVTVE